MTDKRRHLEIIKKRHKRIKRIKDRPVDKGPNKKQRRLENRVVVVIKEPPVLEPEFDPGAKQEPDRIVEEPEPLQPRVEPQVSVVPVKSKLVTHTSVKTDFGEPGPNPGPAFETWVKDNWDAICDAVNACNSFSLPVTIKHCSSDWFDLTEPPKFTRKEKKDLKDQDFGMCDFTDGDINDDCEVFIECKAKRRRGPNAVRISAKSRDLFKTARKHEKTCIYIICNQYQPPNNSGDFTWENVLILGNCTIDKILIGNHSIEPPCIKPIKETLIEIYK